MAKYLELPDGRYMEIQEGMTNDDINQILSSFNDKPEQKPQQATLQDVLREASRQSFGRMPAQAALPEVAAARETPFGQALETGASLLVPSASLPRLGSALSKILPRAGKYITSGIESALPQAAISGGSAGLSGYNPLEHAATTGAIVAPVSSLSDLVTSGDPRMRLLGRLVGMGGAGAAGYYGSKALGATPLESYAAAAGSALLPGVLSKSFAKNKEAEERVINEFLSNVSPEKLQKKAKGLYKETEGVIVPEEKISKLKENQIFKEAEREIERSPAYSEILKDTDPNSVKHLHQVMRKLNAMERSKKSPLSEKSDKTEALEISKVRDQLKNVLYKESPEFAKAQGLAERKIAKDKLESFFDARKKTGQNFMKYISSEKRMNDLNRSLRKDPNALEQVKSLKQSFDKIKDIKDTTKLGKMNVIKDIMNSHKYDKAMQDLASNPAWRGKLKDLNKTSDKEQLVKSFIDLVGKASAQTYSRSKE